jgi:hypothetical protein
LLVQLSVKIPKYTGNTPYLPAVVLQDMHIEGQTLNAYPSHWFPASIAFGKKQIRMAVGAIEIPVSFFKVVRCQFSGTSGTGEVVWVPGLTIYLQNILQL